MRAVRCLSRALACALPCAAVAWSGTAWADGGDLALSWSAPAGCPSGEQVKARALEGTAKASKVDALAADAKVESSAADRWHVTLTTKRGGVTSDARRLEARSCAALADATAVILAMAMIPPGASNEPTAAAAATAPASAGASASDPAAAPEAAPATAAATAPETAAEPAAAPAPATDPDSVSSSLPSSPHALALGGGLTSDASTLPSAAVGGAAFFAWTPGRARVEAAASFFASQSKTTGISSAGAALSLFVIGARGCYAIVKTSAIELSPCGGVDFSFVGASGFGAAANYDASARWASATAGLLVRVPVTSYFAVRAQVDGNVPFSRPTFVVDGEGDVHRPSALGARGGIGLELDFL